LNLNPSPPLKKSKYKKIKNQIKVTQKEKGKRKGKRSKVEEKSEQDGVTVTWKRCTE
jgi:hypothetical protein